MTRKQLLLAISGLAGLCVVPSVAHAQACASNAECGGGTVCYSRVIKTCIGAPMQCDPGGTDTTNVEPTKGQPPDLSTCTDSTVATCAYPWTLPCTIEADCGDGFRCSPKDQGICSASTGALLLSIDTETATDTTTCTTTTSFPGWCILAATSCASDVDCPSLWTCMTLAVPTLGSTPPLTATGSATATTTSIGMGPTTSGTAPTTAPSPPTSTTTSTATGNDTSGLTRSCAPPNSASVPTSVDTATLTWIYTSTLSCTATNTGEIAAPTAGIGAKPNVPSQGPSATMAGRGCGIAPGSSAADVVWLLLLCGVFWRVSTIRRRH